MREFASGATRNTDEGKPDYEAFLSPLVIRSFGEYMQRHRQTPLGEREGDNWQRGFGTHHLDVCIKSLWRHFLDLWMEHRGLGSRSGVDDAINAMLFNLQAYQHHRLTRIRLQKLPRVLHGQLTVDDIPEGDAA